MVRKDLKTVWLKGRNFGLFIGNSSRNLCEVGRKDFLVDYFSQRDDTKNEK
jgi:hypothetical protein